MQSKRNESRREFFGKIILAGLTISGIDYGLSKQAYANPAGAAGAAAGANAAKNNREEDRREEMLQKSGFYEKMKELEDKTNKYLEDARDKFSLAFEDGNLTVEEKREIYSNLPEVQEYINKLPNEPEAKETKDKLNSRLIDIYSELQLTQECIDGKFTKQEQKDILSLADKRNHISRLIRKNLYGLDCGEPELEKYFNEQRLGNHIQCEKAYSCLEKLCTFAGISAFFAGGSRILINKMVKCKKCL